MARYIDADELDDTVQRLNKENWQITRYEYKRIDRVLFEMPTADVQPVIHAQWKGFTHHAYRGLDEYGEPIWREVTVYHCSGCNRRTVIKEKYCPNCGAKMDKENKDDIYQQNKESKIRAGRHNQMQRCK